MNTTLSRNRTGASLGPTNIVSRGLLNGKDRKDCWERRRPRVARLISGGGLGERTASFRRTAAFRIQIRIRITLVQGATSRGIQPQGYSRGGSTQRLRRSFWMSRGVNVKMFCEPNQIIELLILFPKSVDFQTNHQHGGTAYGYGQRHSDRYDSYLSLPATSLIAAEELLNPLFVPLKPDMGPSIS